MREPCLQGLMGKSTTPSQDLLALPAGSGQPRPQSKLCCLVPRSLCQTPRDHQPFSTQPLSPECRHVLLQG